MRSESIECFEIGKFYKHSGGRCMHIVGEANTTVYGWCLVAEEIGYDNLLPIGRREGYTVNWVEIDQKEWLKHFEENENGNNE